jgi:predicted DCC family thiol-disulfide oxidoreductase YuxK
MLDREPQRSSGEGRHLFLFDGVCGLCSRLVRFVLAHDRRRVFNFAALQSPAGRAAVTRSGGNPDDLTTFYVFENYRTPEARRFAKGRAAMFVLSTLGWPWKAAGLLGLLPTAFLDRLYDLVARNRYRVFGRNEQCLVPRPEFRSRFIDST